MNARDSKSRIQATVSRVRIPLSPPGITQKGKAMKKFFLICLFLAGCATQHTITDNTTVHSSVERDDFIESLVIIDCAYRNQGCENGMGFTACVYKLKYELATLSDEQKNMLENNLRTQFGFEKSSDTEINIAADKVLTRYLNCSKK